MYDCSTEKVKSSIILKLHSCEHSFIILNPTPSSGNPPNYIQWVMYLSEKALKQWLHSRLLKLTYKTCYHCEHWQRSGTEIRVCSRIARIIPSEMLDASSITRKSGCVDKIIEETISRLIQSLFILLSIFISSKNGRSTDVPWHEVQGQDKNNKD